MGRWQSFTPSLLHLQPFSDHAVSVKIQQMCQAEPSMDQHWSSANITLPEEIKAKMHSSCGLPWLDWQHGKAQDNDCERVVSVKRVPLSTIHHYLCSGAVMQLSGMRTADQCCICQHQQMTFQAVRAKGV